jgi:hypothetical protein
VTESLDILEEEVFVEVLLTELVLVCEGVKDDANTEKCDAVLL